MAPLAVALLVVAVLFCWAFVETLFIGAADPGGADSVARIAFIAASGVLTLILIGGAAQGINGLFMVVAVQSGGTSGLLCRHAGRAAVGFDVGSSGRGEIRAAAHVMAKGAAHGSHALAHFAAGRTSNAGGTAADALSCFALWARRWCSSGAGTSCRSTTSISATSC